MGLLEPVHQQRALLTRQTAPKAFRQVFVLSQEVRKKPAVLEVHHFYYLVMAPLPLCLPQAVYQVQVPQCDLSEASVHFLKLSLSDVPHSWYPQPPKGSGSFIFKSHNFTLKDHPQFPRLSFEIWVETSGTHNSYVLPASKTGILWLTSDSASGSSSSHIRLAYTCNCL